MKFYTDRHGNKYRRIWCDTTKRYVRRYLNSVAHASSNHTKPREHSRIHPTKQQKIRTHEQQLKRGAIFQDVNKQIAFLLYFMKLVPVLTLWYQQRIIPKNCRKRNRIAKLFFYFSKPAICTDCVWDWYVEMTREFPNITFRQLKSFLQNNKSQKFFQTGLVHKLILQELQQSRMRAKTEIYERYQTQITKSEFDQLCIRAKRYRHRVKQHTSTPIDHFLCSSTI